MRVESRPRKRSARVSRTVQPRDDVYPRPGHAEPQCAFCGVPIVKLRRHRRYCSGRCRARASFQRRVGAAVEAEVRRRATAGADPSG
jgi:hypothetical protein